jgi:hypothetical protein
MAKLKPGDRVDCRIREATIVSPYKDFDEIRTFEIVADDKYGYYLYVPLYIYLKGTVKADKHQCNRLEIDRKFLDADIVYIQENMICRVASILDGMNCSSCREFFAMAGPNQEDGTLICYACRFNPYR